MALNDNIGAFLNQVRNAADSAAKAVGEVAVELVKDQMLIGYDYPIWRTGDLMRSVTFDVKNEGNVSVIDVGTPMEYAPYIHDGTYKMAGRPFMRDALLSNLGKQALKEVFEEQLGNAFR